ncbi:hydrogenase assembly protein HupF [Rhodococcus xishaensis]|uniref:Hydrogenase assembly protein HupF n=1 Tax=Rhodococcus xishaensis TaxID=2487364 RepID=A0A438ARN8_9NOCA|nr:hydrogenase assembly protein HupF [Rhodococcus xishaensis]RVW01367.1 hydrogenase assembly protein HupF [Rhodococcus xishaensis]
MTTSDATAPLIDPELSADLAATALALARRFQTGATLWVVSPQWEQHAHYVAVEFAHPVITGKRALPAVSLVESDSVAQCRVATRPGDVILAVSTADQPQVRDIMRRAPAWGADTVWISSGLRPESGSATHILWVESDDPMVPVTGRFALIYHLLWELTQVCLEHRGLLIEPDPSHDERTEDGSVTSRDEERPAEVVAVSSDSLAGTLVRTGTGEQRVDTTLVGRVEIHDLLLVRGRAAISRIQPDKDVPR